MYKIVTIISITISLFSSFRSLPINQTIDQMSSSIDATNYSLNNDSIKADRSIILRLNDITPDCEKEEHNLSTKTITCLDHCAHCVKQWKNGFYNGPKCAKDCVSNKDKPVGFVDLDCNSEKYFNLDIAVIT